MQCGDAGLHYVQRFYATSPLHVRAAHFPRLRPQVRASQFPGLCPSGPARLAAPFHQLLRYSLLVCLRGHTAFYTHVPKPSRLPTRSPRSKTRRFVYAKRQCASPRSFRPVQPKPPGRLDTTKSNTPSLKVPEIPFKTRLRSLCQAFPFISRASPLDAHSHSDRLPCHARLFLTSTKYIIYKVLVLPPSLDLPGALTELPASIFATVHRTLTPTSSSPASRAR